MSEQTVVYDTAYRESDVMRAIDRCVAAHGRESNVRTLNAPPFPLNK